MTKNNLIFKTYTLITCYCRLIIVFFTTGYPHQLRHFYLFCIFNSIQLYFPNHLMKFISHFSNELFGSPPHPTRLLIGAKVRFHLLLIPAFASTLHLFQPVFVS